MFENNFQSILASRQDWLGGKPNWPLDKGINGQMDLDEMVCREPGYTPGDCSNSSGNI